MAWIIEESVDCGVHWQQATLTRRYLHPRVAMLEALEIIKDEWGPPPHALHEPTSALQDESVAYYWEKAIRVTRGH